MLIRYWGSEVCSSVLIRIEDAHPHYLAERGGHVRDAQFYLATGGRACRDAAVLGPAFLGHVHARQDLDTRGHRGHYRRRQFEHLLHDAVDAETDVPGIAAWLDRKSTRLNSSH